MSPKVVGHRLRRPWLRRCSFDLENADIGAMRSEMFEMYNNERAVVSSCEARCSSTSRHLLANAKVTIINSQRPWWSSPLDAICAIDSALEARVERIEAALRAIGDSNELLKAAIAQALGAKTRTVDARAIDPPVLLDFRSLTQIRVDIIAPITEPFLVHIDLRGIHDLDHL